jgi:hypothetical protein
MNKSSTNNNSKNNIQIYKMTERRQIETVKGSKINDLNNISRVNTVLISRPKQRVSDRQN